MLDVHPPHQAPHSWKDFLIHIATIVIGLLIAIGLEQSVEWIHHRNELRETRRALTHERKLNAARSVAQVKEFRRVRGKLQSNLAIFTYLFKHPGAPPSQWPGKLSSSNGQIGFNDGSWQIAQKSNVISYMPHAEQQQWRELYSRTESSNDSSSLFLTKARAATSFAFREPDPSKLTGEQVDREIDLISDALYQLFLEGNVLANLAERFPDFSAPSRAELVAMRQTQSTPEDVRETQEIVAGARRTDREIEEANKE